MKADAGIGTQIDSRIASTIDHIYDQGGRADLYERLRYLEMTHALAATRPDDAAAMLAYLS